MTDDQDKLTSIPNAKYQKLFSQFKEIETLKTEQWKVPHILGYFVSKYKEAFGVDYQFKFNTPAPSKSFEVWQVKALGGKLSSNPQILRGYIDWVFQEKAPETKRRFTSISFLSKEEFLNEYKWSILTKEKQALSLDRSTPLPAAYQDALAEVPGMKTYGDLAFWIQAMKTDQSTNTHPAILKLEAAGLDFALLEKIV
jgi:hypothetical protein